jgi:transposase
VQNYRVWRRALAIEGKAVVEHVRFETDGGEDEAVVRVRPFRCEPKRCGVCHVVAPGFDQGEGLRRWRALDFGPMKVFIEAAAPRVNCPEHGKTVVAVPWARHKARHTHYFDQTVTWLIRHTANKSVLVRFLRIAWATIGVIVDRVMGDVAAFNPDRYANLRRIGIDEVSYQKGHKYLTVVVDHATGRLLWVGLERTKRTLGKFFDSLGEERCNRIALVSADGADWIADMVGLRCPNAKLCLDPYHAVTWVTKALDKVRARVTTSARNDKDTATVEALKDSKWALLKNPEDLKTRQRAKLSVIQQTNLELYRAYLLKEQFRQIFARGGEERVELLDAWLAWASRCRVPEMVHAARRIRPYYDDIVATLVHGLTNAIVEGLNSRVRLIINIARGFRTPEALMALMQLHLGDYQPHLPGRPVNQRYLPGTLIRLP